MTDNRKEEAKENIRGKPSRQEKYYKQLEINLSNQRRNARGETIGSDRYQANQNSTLTPTSARPAPCQRQYDHERATSQSGHHPRCVRRAVQIAQPEAILKDSKKK